MEIRRAIDNSRFSRTAERYTWLTSFGLRPSPTDYRNYVIHEAVTDGKRRVSWLVSWHGRICTVISVARNDLCSKFQPIIRLGCQRSLTRRDCRFYDTRLGSLDSLPLLVFYRTMILYSSQITYAITAGNARCDYSNYQLPALIAREYTRALANFYNPFRIERR